MNENMELTERLCEHCGMPINSGLVVCGGAYLHDKCYTAVMEEIDESDRRQQAARLSAAVAERFVLIRPNLKQRYDASDPRDGGYIYGGYRCQPESLYWRFHQRLRTEGAPAIGQGLQAPITDQEIQGVINGEYDKEIEETWHDAASAEHWYRYEKDWGHD